MNRPASHTQHSAFNTQHALSLAFTIGCCFTTLTLAQTSDSFDLSWHTMDGGGETSMTSPSFQLSGTIAQSDPGFVASAGYDLEGGFWVSGAGQSLCACPGDVNADGFVDGDDVGAFVNCLFGTAPPDCTCADLNNSGTVDAPDVALFVTTLLSGNPGCS